MRSLSLLLCCLAFGARADSRAASELLEFLPDAAVRRAQRLGFSRDLELPGPGASPRGLTGRVPALANAAFVVEDTGGAASRLSFTLEGAAAVGGASFDREFTWPRAYPDVDVLAFATGQLLELSYLLHTASAPRRFTWKLEVPVGASWRTEAGGRLLLERAGQPLLAIPRPRAVDATGQELAVRVGFEGDALSFTLVGSPRAFPVLLDPVLEVPLWELKVAGDPFPRWNMGAAYDPPRNVTLVFGGTTPFGASNETWIWNGLKWKLLSPALSPPGRTEASMVFDAARGVVVLLGGRTLVGGSLTDTWTWNGLTWTLASSTVPIAAPYALTWDSDRSLVVAISRNGGVATWDGSSWTVVPVIGSPPPFFRGFAAAYDPNTRNVVVFGGDTGVVLSSETWLFTGTSWLQSQVGTAGPPARVGHAMAFDPRRNAVVMIGGSPNSAAFPEAWTWSGSNWSPTANAPPAIRNHALVYDSGRSRLVALGGDVLDVSLANWEEVTPGAPWQRAEDASQPLARFGAAMTFDSNRQVSVLVGGGRHGLATGDTWEWNGVGWLRRAPGPPRVQHALAFDPEKGVSVAFGGNETDFASAWDGTTWRPRAGRDVRKASLTWSSTLGLLQYGGIDRVGNHLDSLWVAAPDGGWDPLASAGPDFIGSHAATFDEARGKLVLIGQRNTSQAHTEWSAADGFVSQAIPFLGPPVLPAPSLAWDSDRSRVVLFSHSLSQLQGFLWEWDGASWSTERVATLPPPDTQPVITYDGNRRRVVLQTSTGQTWEHSVLRPLSSACSSDPECRTGLCVDGVCCNDACGGGVADCQACSVLTGSCELGPPTELCRPAATCASASFCSGQSPECPPSEIDASCVSDAGAGDAGVGDAGVNDAGVSDAGPEEGVDAGLVIFTAKGCQTTGLGPLLMLVCFLLRRR